MDSSLLKDQVINMTQSTHTESTLKMTGHSDALSPGVETHDRKFKLGSEKETQEQSKWVRFENWFWQGNHEVYEEQVHQFGLVKSVTFIRLSRLISTVFLYGLWVLLFFNLGIHVYYVAPAFTQWSLLSTTITFTALNFVYPGR